MARLYVADDSGDELWRSTVIDPTATADFEEDSRLPVRARGSLGLTSHADRLYVPDNSHGDELMALDGS